MRYLVSVTDLHSALIEGIRRDGDIVLRFPKRGRRAEKLRRVPEILAIAARVALDRDSHVLVSHPFSIVNAALIFFARRVSFFDDGTAYYTCPPLPTGRREALDRWLTKRFVPWDELLRLSGPTYVDMIGLSHAQELYSMFPKLMRDLSVPVKAIDMDRAFPPAHQHGRGMSVFLDTMDFPMHEEAYTAVLRHLQEAANASPDGLVYFRPHPAQVSRVSSALRKAPWARELTGVWEELVSREPIAQIFSFYSSGAIGAKLTRPECLIVNFQHPSQAVDQGLRDLFEELDALEIEMPPASDERTTQDG